MLKAFTARKPWAALVISLAFWPVFGMVYLGRGKLAAIYLSLGIFVSCLYVVSLITDTQLTYLWWSLIFLGSIHVYYITSKKDFVFLPKWYSCWYILPLILISLILFSLSFRALITEPFSQPASSMAPTVYEGDQFLSDKFAYGYSRYSVTFLDLSFKGRILSRGHLPQYGDLVTFRLPTNTSIQYFKRIVGLPGDTLQMIDGRLYINQRLIPREKFGSKQIEQNDQTIMVTEYIETLPNGSVHHVYEESDNGPLDNTQEYKVPYGQYFMMGDNRDNSQDSRVMKRVGFIPFENITGKVHRIFYRNHKITWLPL